MFFIDFQNSWNFCWKLADFWPKNRHFFADAAKILKPFFRRKSYLVCGKSSNWSKNRYKCTLGSLLQLQGPIFFIFHFFPILRLPKCPERAKNSYILPKIDLLAHFGTRKIGKKRNINKIGPWSCSRDPKVHLYPFLEQLDHFPQTRYDFRRKIVF